MSISTLKKKTQAKYNNMSVGQSQFSLNGTRRSQGWVGQSMLSRSLPKTPMQGLTPKGHGGCCGSYDRSHGIIQSAVSSLNNNNIIKPSVISNKGMLEEKITPYRNYLMPYPYVSAIPKTHATCTTVKTTDSNQGDIGIYIENLGASVNKKVDSCTKNQSYSNCICPIVDAADVDPTDQLYKIKGIQLNCDNNYTTPVKYNEIFNKKGIQYKANGTYTIASNPSNGTVLPGPAASY